jgi:hypothetical protein
MIKFILNFTEENKDKGDFKLDLDNSNFYRNRNFEMKRNKF